MENKDLTKSGNELSDQTNINDHIEFLANSLNPNVFPNNAFGLTPSLDERRVTGYEISMYSYLRDHSQAKTLGEVRIILEQRKIDSKIVKLWIEENMALNNREFDAISKGYPEFQEDLERVRTAWIETILKRKYG